MNFGSCYRDRIGIMSDILEVAKGDGATKTKIMYNANLSHDQMKYYTRILTEKHFIMTYILEDSRLLIKVLRLLKPTSELRI